VVWASGCRRAATDPFLGGRPASERRALTQALTTFTASMRRNEGHRGMSGTLRDPLQLDYYGRLCGLGPARPRARPDGGATMIYGTWHERELRDPRHRGLRYRIRPASTSRITSGYATPFPRGACKRRVRKGPVSVAGRRGNRTTGGGSSASATRPGGRCTPTKGPATTERRP